MVQDISGLTTLAEVGIGIAGFSGVFAVLTGSGKLIPAERFRLEALLKTSIGATFLAMAPHAFFAGTLKESVIWLILGSILGIYCVFLLPLIPRAFALRADNPHLFSTPVMVLQAIFIVVALLLAIALFFVSLPDKLSVYTTALVVLLLASAVVFYRLLFYRKPDDGAQQFVATELDQEKE